MKKQDTHSAHLTGGDMPDDRKNFELRIPLGKNGFLIWNKGLIFGETTPNEDLWNAGYEFWPEKIFGIKFIRCQKRYA